MKVRTRVIGCLSGLLVACTPTPVEPVEGRVIELHGPGYTIRLHVEIADEPAEWASGLMYRSELPEGRGMLFLFPDEQERSFWMKNTLIPLDIIFFDAQHRLVSTRVMKPCEADPCDTYPSDGPAQSALEVPAGFVERTGVGTGWLLVVPD